MIEPQEYQTVGDLSVDLRVEHSPLTEVQLQGTYADHLTGLHDRQWLTHALEHEVTQNPGNFSLLFVDLDGLKTVNDRFGHAAGDDHIIRCAESLRSSLRSGRPVTPQARPRAGDDLAEGTARLGGDEFVIIARQVTRLEDLEAIRRRIQTNLGAIGISASIGGRVHLAGESGSDLLSAADALMYQDKRTRKQEQIGSLALHRKAAYLIGRTLIRYSGVTRPQ